MGLKLTHDGTGPGDTQENCCLCRTPTRFWFGTGRDNVAVCEPCGQTSSKEDLPTKSKWFDKERRLAANEARRYGMPSRPHYFASVVLPAQRTASN